MYIGKIVNSSSHVEYVCQVYGPHEAEEIPAASDCGFGTFVGIEREEGGCLVGLISNTTLLNPEFGNLGPRLSPQEDLAVFSPDYLAEQAVLVAITVVGAAGNSSNGDGEVIQGVPVVAAGIDARVRRLEEEDIRHFHRPNGTMQLGYLPLLMGMAHNPLMPSLMLQLMDNLSTLFPDQARQLAILRGNLAWRARVQPAG